jgi:putative DNA primase/helicase
MNSEGLTAIGATTQEWQIASRFAPGALLPLNGKRPTLSNWPAHNSTPSQIAAWQRLPQNIGIICRAWVAIDVDVIDATEAAAIRQLLNERGWLHAVRGRSDSAKFLIPVFVGNHSLTKRVIQTKTAGGKIELLAKGQQFAAFGTHPDGARYTWSGSLELARANAKTSEAITGLFDWLAVHFGNQTNSMPTIARQSSVVAPSVHDPIAEFLIANDWVLEKKPNGTLNIRCPFADEHTTDGVRSTTSFFPAGSGFKQTLGGLEPFARGHFKCLHAHCSARTDANFLDAVGFVAGQVKIARSPVSLIRADSIKLEPIDWLWKDYLPAGMFALLAGAPGGGKTTLALALAAVITTSGKWPDGTQCGEAGDVAVWSGEDTNEVLTARFIASDGDARRLHFISESASGKQFNPAKDIAPLVEALPEKTRLLIIDPIVNATTGDTNSNADVRQSLQPLVSLAKQRGIAVLGITHFSKGSAGKNPVERVNGSIAYAGLARVVLVAAKDENVEAVDNRIFILAKSNIGPDAGGFSYSLKRKSVAPEVEGQYVEWGNRLEGNARDLLGTAEQSEGKPVNVQKNQVREWLAQQLQCGPMPAKEVLDAAQDLGYTVKQVKEARTTGGFKSEKMAMNAGWLWSLQT